MKKNVNMMTTYHTDETKNVTCKRQEKIKPMCVELQNMGRVDLKDPPLVNFLIKQKHMNKWYKMRF
jgi:hypothetical protein